MSLAPTAPAASEARNLLVIKILYFLSFTSFGVYVTYINVYYRDIGLSGAQIGWISATVPLVAMLSGPLWGLLSDRIGSAKMLLTAAALGSIAAMLALSAAAEYIWILLLAGVLSLFNGAVPALMDSINLAWLGEQRDRYGRQRIWGSIGFIVSSAGMGVWIKQVGLKFIFPSYAVMMFTLLLGLFFLSNTRLQAARSPVRVLTEFARDSRWLFFAASLVLLGIPNSGINNFLGIYLKDLGGDEALIGAVFSLGAVAELPVMYFSSAIIRRVGLERMLVTGFLVYAIRVGLYAVMPSPIWALPIALLHGLSFGAFWVAGVVYVNRLAPPNLKATSQTLFMAVLNLSNMIGAVFSGAIFDQRGPSFLFWTYAVLCLAGLGILLFSFRSEHRLSRPPSSDL